MIIAKYKFDKSIYDNLIPEFNTGFINYEIVDEYLDTEDIVTTSTETMMLFNSDSEPDEYGVLTTEYEVENVNIFSAENIVTRSISSETLPTQIIFGNKYSEPIARTNSLLEVHYLNVSKVTSMENMFNSCIYLTSLDVSNFNTSKVTNMKNMFQFCYKLTSLDVSNWDTSSLINANHMFYNCYNLTSIDVNNWDTSNITDMGDMFAGCIRLSSLDVSSWDTSNVLDITNFIQNCYSLTSIDLSNWDTSNVTAMGGVFDDIGINVPNAEIRINISNFDTKNVTDFSWLFHSSDAILEGKSYNIKELNIANLDLSSAIEIENLISPIYAMNIENPIIKCNVIDTIKIFAERLPSRISLSTSGYIVTTPEIKDQIDDETIEMLASKNWIVYNGIVAIYTYHNYDFVPTFNDGFDYEYTDIYDSSAMIVTRTITSDTLPTFISFGETCVQTVEYLNVSKVTSMENMFNDCTFLTSVNTSDWDTSNVTNMYAMFYNCNSLTSLDVSNFNTSKVTNMYGMFCNCPLSSLDVSNFNTNKVTNMEGMFYYCENLTSLDVSNWNTGLVTNMGYMFYYCNKLTSLDVSNWNTGLVANMGYMFCDCNNLTSLDVSDWDTSNVTDMGEMFYDCKDLATLDVSNWNTDKVTNMYNMFNGCILLTTLDVSNWNTENVTNMRSMFAGCERLTTLDVSNWNTGKVTNMRTMFENCDYLAILNVDNWDTSKVTDMSGMFDYGGISSLNLSKWDVSNVTNMRAMFYACGSLTSLDVTNWDVSNVTNMQYMFCNCHSLRVLNISGWDLYSLDINESSEILGDAIEVINLSGCSKLTVNKIVSQLPDKSSYAPNVSGLIVSQNVLRYIDKEYLLSKNWSTNKRLIARYTFLTNVDTVPNFNTVSHSNGATAAFRYFTEDIKNSNNGTTTRELYTFNEEMPSKISFTGKTALRTIEYLYTNNLNTMNTMFKNCTNLTSIDTSNWDTGKVTDMSDMFASCSLLTTLDISNWDTSKVTSMASMLSGCESLTSLNLNNLDVSKVQTMNYMFYGCRKLTSLNLKYWDTNKVGNMAGMFNSCEKLTYLDLSSFNINNTTTLDKMFAYCYELKDLFLNNWSINLSAIIDNIFLYCTSLRHVSMINSNKETVNKMVGALPSRTATSTGQVIVGDQSGISASGANSANKYWATLVQENNKFTFSADAFKYFIRSFKNRFALKSEVNSKVDKVEGKGLSTKDFTDSYCESCKNVLSNVQIGKIYERRNWIPYSTDVILYFEQNNEDSYLELFFDDGEGVTIFSLDIDRNAFKNLKFKDKDGEDWTPTLTTIEEDADYIAAYYEDFCIYYRPYDKELSVEYNESVFSFYVYIPKYKGVTIPFDKYRPSGLIVGCDTNFICEPDEEYRIYFKYASSNPYLSDDKSYGKHTLVLEFTESNGQIRKDKIEYDNYDEIPNYYSYMANANDVSIKMYFIDKLGIRTGVTYLKPIFKNFVIVYEYNTSGGYEVLPVFNSGYTNYTINDKTKKNSIERTITSNSIPSSINFSSEYFITKATYMSQKITNMSGAFEGCYGLKETCVYGNKITDMSNMYRNCSGLIKAVDCGTNVTNMSNAYTNCYSLTGPPMCGNNVTNMRNAYKNCISLTGFPVCGTNVINMSGAYDHCYNLTGSPVCGDNVTDMSYSYYGCNNLTGSPVCGNNVTKMSATYYNCQNLHSNGYFYSNNITNVGGCFGKKDNSKRLNVYIPDTGTTLNTIINNTASTNSITWENIEWTYDNTFPVDAHYYNTAQNIYVYPVDNVAEMHDIHNRAIVSFISPYQNLWPDITVASGSSDFETIIKDSNYSSLTSILRTHDDTRVERVSFQGTGVQKVLGLCDTITNMSSSFYSCSSLTGSPICGNNVKDMSLAYADCYYLTGAPVCGCNVVNMDNAYKSCYNLTGSPACGDKVTRLSYAYASCSNLTGNAACGNNVTDMCGTYYGCSKLTGSPVCGPNVTNMVYTYAYCYNLTGNPACGPNVTNMDSTYENCYNLTGNPACGPNVESLSSAYSNCYSLTGSPVCSDNVIDMYFAYFNCYNLTGSPVCGNNVTYMEDAYGNCQKLTGNPVCGPNVTDMDYAYVNCRNLTGVPVCGDKVTKMDTTYSNCINLTGSPVCGPNVTRLNSTYEFCGKLTGAAVCGEKVINMAYAYWNCINLTGPATVGANVSNASSAFSGCSNLQGNIYVISNSANTRGLISSTNNSLVKNIYVHPNTDSLWNIITSTSSSIFNASGITWRNEMSTNNRYVCMNTYVYPINDVRQLYKENELGVIVYSTTNTKERPVSMLGATQGYGISVDGSNIKLYKNSESDVITHISFKGSTTLTSIVSMTDSITNMTNAFCDCSNLTSRPMCGNNVVTMDCAYKNCRSLTRGPIIGSNVTNMKETFNECTNIYGSGYIYSNKVNFASNCFRNRSNSKMLNLYVPITGYNATHNTLNAFLKTDSSSIVGSSITWTNDTANNRYYNAVQNVYIYPVNDPSLLYKENELEIAKYIVNGTNYTVPVVQKEVVASDGTKELVDIGITSESIDNGDGTRTVLVYSNDDVQPNKISFDYMTELISVEKLKSDQITNADYMFRGCKKLTSICNGNFELPNVETAVGIYQGCYNLQ